MSENLEIKLRPSDQKKLDRLANRAALLQAMAKELDRQNLLTVAGIQRRRLTGQGPFPPSQQRLGIVTGRLRAAVAPGLAFIDGETIHSSIGCSVKYAWIHEHGGVIKMPPRKGSVRLRTDKAGNLLRHGKNGKLATFAKAGHKRVKEVQFESKAYEIHMPPRAPIWAGIMDRKEDSARGIAKSVTAYLKNN